MDFSVLGIGLSFIAGLFGMQVEENVQIQLNDPVEWSCEKHTWVNGPRQDGNKIKGRLEVNCEFKAVGKGGYPQLEKALIARILKEASTVHSGPKAEQYKGMPSTFIDASAKLSKKKDMSLTARQEVHIATDMTNKLLFDMFSKKLQGTGYAEYLKKVDMETAVLATGEPHVYRAQLSGYFVLDKPWFAPGGMIISRLKDEVNKRIKKIEKSVLTELALNI